MMKRITKKIILVAVALTSAVGWFSPTSAETPKLVQFHMAFLSLGPKWESTTRQERESILKQHQVTALAMLKSGKAIIISSIGHDPDRVVIFILRAPSAAEAKAWVDADPAVNAGLYIAEMHPWWSEDIFKPPNSPPAIETVYLGFLKKGPNRKEGDDETPEIQELQTAHIANINRLAKLKKLVAAGPFGDDGNLRGIFVFRVASLQEAQELCATDPMIKIGRLVVELHPWRVPEGVLP
jgi:uncharacterized protein YciI